MSSWCLFVYHYFESCALISFTESDQCQISPVASPKILHHAVWWNWLFIAYSDKRFSYYQILTISLIHFSLKVWEKYFLNLGVKGPYFYESRFVSHSLPCSMWLGIELDQPVGKNDGTVSGIRYFTCQPNHGVFAPPSKVERYWLG